jgi:hypothetical protein
MYSGDGMKARFWGTVHKFALPFKRFRPTWPQFSGADARRSHLMRPFVRARREEPRCDA